VQGISRQRLRAEADLQYYSLLLERSAPPPPKQRDGPGQQRGTDLRCRRLIVPSTWLSAPSRVLALSARCSRAGLRDGRGVGSGGDRNRANQPIRRGVGKSVGSRRPAETGSGRMGQFGGEVEEGVGSHDCAPPPSPCLPFFSPSRPPGRPTPAPAQSRPSGSARSANFFRGRRASLGDYVSVGVSGRRGVGGGGIRRRRGVGASGVED